MVLTVTQRSISDSTTPKVEGQFPLLLLPPELQLLILRHILVSPLPLLNITVPANRQEYLLEHEEKGQDLINHNMIFTSKFFYQEGVDLLYSSNIFQYSQPTTMFSFLSLPPSDICAKQCPMYTQSECPCGRDVALRDRLQHLSVRLPETADPEFLFEMEGFLRIVDRFKSLRTLRLDLFDVQWGFEWVWDADMDGMEDLQREIEKRVKLLDGPERNGRLDSIILTGLPETDMGLFVMQEYSRLLQPEGKMGIGWGIKGRRYRMNDKVVERQEACALHWMGLADIGPWIL